MSSHTLGPWTLSPSRTYVERVYAPDEGGGDELGGIEKIAAVCYAHGDQRANARLIAAAPDLLTFVRMLHERLQSHEDGSHIYEGVFSHGEMEDIRALLASLEVGTP